MITSLLPLVAKDFSNQVAPGLDSALLAHSGNPETHTFLMGWTLSVPKLYSSLVG